MRKLVLELRDCRQRGLGLLDLAGESVPLEVEQQAHALRLTNDPPWNAPSQVSARLPLNRLDA
jgi:hypothetical protein